MSTLLCSRYARAVSSIGALVTGFGIGASADQVTVDCHLAIVRDGAKVAVVSQVPPECDPHVWLESASGLNGPWTIIADAAKPFVLPNLYGSHQLYRAVWLPPFGSPSASEITEAVHAFIVSTHPEWNPATEFGLRILPVQGLWEAMQVQLVSVSDWSGGVACILHKDQVKFLGWPYASYGLMSGLARGEGFYYTYSWGSGVHRSHVGKLQIVNGAVKFWDSGGIFNQIPNLMFLDLFVSGTADGGITILRGRWDFGFNQWRTDAEFGRIDESEPSAPTIIGTDGSVLATLVPTEYSF